MGRIDEFFRFADPSGDPKKVMNGAEIMDVAQGPQMQEYMDTALTTKTIPHDEDVRLQNAFGHDDARLRAVNDALRSGSAHPDAPKLDQWVSSQKTTRPISTYRSVVVPKDVHEKWVPGSTFSDNGFAFTSPYRRVASIYGMGRQKLHAEGDPSGDSGDRVILRYDLPEGHPATNAQFGEMVLPRGMNMSVASRKEGANGTVNIVLRHPDLDKDN